MKPPDPSIREAIRAQILKVGKLDPTELRPDAELVRELGLSSLELLEVLAFIEQTYGVTLPDEELVGLTTLARIVARVQELLARDATGAKDRA